MANTSTRKLGKCSFIIFLLLTSLLGFSQTTDIYDYVFSFNPDVTKNKPVTLATALLKDNSSCLTSSSSIYMNAFLFKYTINKKEFQDLHYSKGGKEGDVQKWYISTMQGKKLNRAVLNIGNISSTGNFCKKLTDLTVNLKHQNNISLNDVLKKMIIGLLSKSKRLKDTTNFELVIAPFEHKGKSINQTLRDFIKTNDQTVQARQMYFIWDKGEVAKLPSLLINSNYTIYQLFKSTNSALPKQTHTVKVPAVAVEKSATDKKPAKTAAPPKLKLKVDSNYLTIHFQGFCPDGLTINYVVYSTEGENLTGAKSATTNSKTIKIPKKDFQQFASSSTTLLLELTPYEPNYYINTIEDSSKINFDDSSKTIEFTMKDIQKRMFFSNIPEFHIIYIDANSFTQKIKMAKTLKKKLENIEAGNDKFFIYLANGIHPFYASNKEGYLNILSRVTTQNTTIGKMSDDWASIAQNIDLSYLQNIGSESVYFDLFLSKNIFQFNNNEIIQIIEDNIGYSPWNLSITTDFKIKNKLKAPKDLDIGKITYNKL